MMTYVKNRTVLQVTGAALASAIGLTAGAQTAPLGEDLWRLIDAGDLRDRSLDPALEPRSSVLYAINNDGEAVGGAIDDSDDMKAIIFLVTDKYGLVGENAITRKRVWSLGTLVLNDFEQSVAFDISDNGFVVGTSNRQPDSMQPSLITKEVFIWNKTDDGSGNALARLVPGGTLKPGVFDANSYGWGINDGAISFSIAGHSESVDDPTICPGGESSPFGFTLPVVLDQNDELVLGTLSDRRGGAMNHERALVFGINNDQALAGTWRYCGTGGLPACGTTAENGTRSSWLSGATAGDELPRPDNPGGQSVLSTEFDETGGAAYGINSENALVGTIGYRSGQVIDGECDFDPPVYWPTTQIAVILPTPPEMFNPPRPGTAYASNINEKVVGLVGHAGPKPFDEETVFGIRVTEDPGDIGEDVNHAALWEEIDGVWVRTNLNTWRADGSRWFLTAVYDINDSDTMVGLANRSIVVPFTCMDNEVCDGSPGPNGSPGPDGLPDDPCCGGVIDTSRGYILKRVTTCPADCEPPIVGNGVVNIDDLLAMVQAIASDTEAIQSTYCDIAPVPDDGGIIGNGVVNIDDLMLVLSSFGSCGTSSGGASGSVVVENIDFSNGYKDETGTVVGDVTAVSDAWVAFDQSWDVYRVWVEVPDANTEIDAVGASEDNSQPVVLANMQDSYFNETTAGGDTAPNPAFFATYPQLAFDSFVTIGSATSSGTAPTIQGSLDLSKNIAKDDLAWYRTGGVAPVAGGSTGWRVLVGQFTVPDGETFTGSLRITGDGIDEYVTFSSAQ